MAGSKHWTEVSTSAFEWERDALDFVRERFPEGDAYRAWSNFEFIDHDGSINEVDLLVFSPRGAFLVEIKSWPERTTGDAGTWTREFKDGRRPRVLDNPLLLANRKAKRLKSLLEEQLRRDGENPKRLPFLQPLIFLSHPNVTASLTGQARVGVCLRDRDEGSTPGGFPGIVETLTRVTAEDKGRPRFRPGSGRDAAVFAKALQGVGIRETTSHRKAGEWELGALLEEGEGWQEYVATRPDAPDLERRIRIFGPDSTRDRALVTAAAKREFETLDPIEHPGILSPREMVEAEQGPALIYPADSTSIRLDHYLKSVGDRLTIDQRTSMIRQLGEAIAYAHARDLTHRALRPSSILVTNPDDEDVELRIRDWHVAHRSTGETQHTGTLTAHADLLIESEADVYLAPESGRSRSGIPLDVFGLGALAFLIFSGRPPATSLIEREAHLRQHGGLDLASVMDGASETQRLMILDATCPQVPKRTESAKAFLVGLDAVEDELRGSSDEDAEPTSASKGELLAGYEVLHRLGRGSTAIAYLVSDEGEERVLKVAASPRNNARIIEEGEVLAKVRDPSVVELQRDGIVVGGHAAILIDYAGAETLADRLRSDGPPGLEILERWGEDLLRTVSSLEEQGVAHRDIKPDNIGVRRRPPNNALRLTLFDFSLSRAPLESIEAGTPAYVDPFLRDPKRGKWDLSAERFSLALTLHELATGQLPRWGDGVSDPFVTDEEVELEPRLFDPGVADELCGFFRTALARDADARFESAEDMLRAWRACFASAGSKTGGELDADARDRAFAEASPVTPVGDLPYSARAVSALRNAGISSAADLISSSEFELRSLTGVGAETRDEILVGYGKLRERLTIDEPPDVQSLDLLADQLVPKRGRDSRDLELMRLYLGLEGDPWISSADLAEREGESRARIDEVVQAGRERWYKTLKSARRLGDEIDEQLVSDGGFLPAEMLEQAMLARRGSLAEGDERRRVAAACVRAAFEAEQYKESPRFQLARSNGEIVIAKEQLVDPAAALTYLKELGTRIDSVVEDRPVFVSRAAELLQSINPPGASQLPAGRLSQLAVHASDRVSRNERGELYPRGMPASNAVSECAGLLATGRGLSIDDIRSLVGSRYPDAAPLPGRPELDDLLSELGLEWHGSSSTYEPVEAHTSYTHASKGSTTELGPEPLDKFQERLERSLDRFQALTARSRYAAAAEERLGRLDHVQVVSLDETLVEHMKEVAAEYEADWGALVNVDREGASGRSWNSIVRVAKEAAERVKGQLLAIDGTVVLTRIGLLRRYDDHLDLIHAIRSQVQDPSDDTKLKGLWILLPTESKDALPVVDNIPIPVLDKNEWAHIPTDWIRSPAQ